MKRCSMKFATEFQTIRSSEWVSRFLMVCGNLYVKIHPERGKNVKTYEKVTWQWSVISHMLYEEWFYSNCALNRITFCKVKNTQIQWCQKIQKQQKVFLRFGSIFSKNNPQVIVAEHEISVERYINVKQNWLQRKNNVNVTFNNATENSEK